MAKKKTGKKAAQNNGPSTKQVDPPVIVGGGSSTLVWLLKGSFTKVAIPKPTAYLDSVQIAKYDCYQTNKKTITIFVGDGENAYSPNQVKNEKTHNTRFSDV